MAGKDDYRIFVGGLSWDVTERQLESAFSRCGRIVEAQIMVERDTGRPRGFGFITFSDSRGMEDAIREMNGRELGEKTITVNKAQPRMGSEDTDHGYRGGYPSGGRPSFGGGDRSFAQDECFKCGRPGHWARDCPSMSGPRGGGGPFSSRSHSGGYSAHGERFGDRDRYIDDHYDGGRFGDMDRFDSRDNKYGARDRYASDRHPPGGDRFASDRYGGPDHHPQNGYGKDRGFEQDAGPRGGGGMAHNEGRSYRNRARPYDRPVRAGHPGSVDRY